jgi:cell division septation protein DedD
VNIGTPAITPSVAPIVPTTVAPTAAARTPSEPAVTIPKDAKWTLYCASLSGADRVARAAQLKAYLIANTPFKDWYIVHNERDSTLFYGFYSEVEKSLRGSAAKAHQDRNAISEWKDEKGERPFVTCFFTPITPADPTAPAEWNLVNAPQRAYWSVQIAAFKDNPQRKAAATDMVRELRARNVEAYYFHGTSISSVCIGAWPANALKEQDTDMAEAQVNQDDVAMVSSDPLPERYKNARMKTRDGQKIVPFAQRVEIADVSLKATLKEYPEHFVNYEAPKKVVKDADGVQREVVSPSFLVKIPRDDPNFLNGGGTAAGLLNPTGLPGGDARQRPAAGTTPLRGLGN